AKMPAEPLVGVRPPLRVPFSYAATGQAWQPTWRGADRLPAAVRVTVRDAATSQVLTASSASTVHVNAPAACANPKLHSCSDLQGQGEGAAAQGAQGPEGGQGGQDSQARQGQ